MKMLLSSWLTYPKPISQFHFLASAQHFLCLFRCYGSLLQMYFEISDWQQKSKERQNKRENRIAANKYIFLTHHDTHKLSSLGILGLVWWIVFVSEKYSFSFTSSADFHLLKDPSQFYMMHYCSGFQGFFLFFFNYW